MGGAAGSVQSGGAAGSEQSGGAGGSTSSGGTSSSSGFPNTPILDDFNRADGAPGSNWVGSTLFSIVDQKLSCDDCASPVLWQESFGETQEVYRGS